MTLCEQVFRKMGWKLEPDERPECDGISWWWSADKKDGGYFQELPLIDSQWEVTAKYLVAFMREREYYWIVHIKFGVLTFKWMRRSKEYMRDYEFEIIDDNIAEAACKSFMEVSLD